LSCESRRPTNLEEEFFFLTERAGDVIENKGPLWKTQGLSGNVIENKGSYALKAGMLLKRKEVDGRSQTVGEGRTGFTSQDSGFSSRESGVRIKSICSPPTAYGA
jgi:hypothetical protein